MIEIPIKTAPGLNAREHWQQRARRTRKEREATAWVLRSAARPQIPCAVLLTRAGPSPGMDDDNLAGAMKAVRDEVARWLGIDDRSPQVRYRYAQCRARTWSVRVEFGPPASGAQYVLGVAA